MRLNKGMKQLKKDSTQRTTGLQRPGRKAPGTRLGILQDWREGSSNSGKPSAGIGKALRDGR
jgi:hypothetical protein